MSVLVTGSEGFIGAELVRLLESEGLTVKGFDIAVDAEQDVASYESVLQAVERVDFVFHLAGVTDVWNSDKSAVFDANVVGLRNVLKACEVTGTPVIFSSSVAARKPDNLYALSKEIGESLCESSDADVRWVRFSNVVGGGTEKGQVYAMAEQAVSDGEIEVWGDGELKRSYVTVKTIVSELFELMDSDERGFCGELGSQTMTNLEMAELIADAVSGEVTISVISKMPPSPRELVVSDVDGVSVRSGVSETVSYLE